MVTWNEFVRITIPIFNYLEADFGFKNISTEEPFITYSSQFVKISIYYEIGRHHELSLSFQLIKQVDKTNYLVGLGMLIRYKDVERKEQTHISPFPKTEHEIKTELKKLSSLLLKYGKGVIEGDITDLEQIQKVRNSWMNNPK